MNGKASFYTLVIVIILATSFLYSLSDYPKTEAIPVYGLAIIIIVILILTFAVLKIWNYGENEEHNQEPFLWLHKQSIN